jgi:hypothetical protein
MGNGVFRNCSLLKEFTIPPLVTQLGSYTFADCISLETVNGIERMTSIGINCFDGCPKLCGAIILNEALLELGTSTFRDCISLEKIIFKGTPTTVANNVFSNCINIKDIYVPWAEGEVANAPWGATKATIHYNTTYDENDNPIDYSLFLSYVRSICERLDCPTPVLIKTHLFNYAKYNNVKFTKDDFVESVDFDKLVLENATL